MALITYLQDCLYWEFERDTQLRNNTHCGNTLYILIKPDFKWE